MGQGTDFGSDLSLGVGQRSLGAFVKNVTSFSPVSAKFVVLLGSSEVCYYYIIPSQLL